MTREEVKRIARKRLRWVEDNYRDCEHHESIAAYAQLLRLVAYANYEDYFRSCTYWQSINKADAYDGKQELGLGELTRFEFDCLDALDAEIERREQGEAHKSAVQPITHN